MSVSDRYTGPVLEIPPPPTANIAQAAAVDLGRLVTRLRRAVNRAARAQETNFPIRESHVEILRVVNESPCRIQDVADTLHLAHNTVSTAAQQMVEHGLLEKFGDGADGRVVRLRLTEVAEQQIDQWRKRRALIVAEQIERLSPADRQTLVQALPVLETLVSGLEANG
jgi:DNA-binding MarR family transcriptional regulator